MAWQHLVYVCCLPFQYFYTLDINLTLSHGEPRESLVSPSKDSSLGQEERRTAGRKGEERTFSELCNSPAVYKR